uniref:Immunoglobulin V-set domain-containing protein n=1 Tax=Hippocampus comes TaxID=109280 RepID=A0A3Q2YT32_HIPCM
MCTAFDALTVCCLLESHPVESKLGLWVKLNSPLLFILWLPKQSAVPDELKAPKVVRGAFGESLTVPCRYQPQFRNNTKYWCRGPIYELCKIVAKTPKQRNHDRWSIADDKEAGVFIVTMRALRPSDKDMYWCVVARPGRNIFTECSGLCSFQPCDVYFGKQQRVISPSPLSPPPPTACCGRNNLSFVLTK